MGDSFSCAAAEIQTQFDLPDHAERWVRLDPLFARSITGRAVIRQQLGSVELVRSSMSASTIWHKLNDRLTGTG